MHRVFTCYVSVPLYTKIYFELEVGQEFWKKKKILNFIGGCGGYILIKSKWFQNTKFLELAPWFPTQGFALDP